MCIEADIMHAASEFRNAIEILNDDQRDKYLSYFPSGCCGNASLLLGAYLHECGLGDFQYICGMRGEQSHAWLEKDGLIVDITSDQFDKGVRVYVGKRNGFYRRFRIDFHHLWDASLDDKTIQGDRLYPLYLLILEHIDNKHTV